jgi:site-specific recombinase XerD
MACVPRRSATFHGTRSSLPLGACTSAEASEARQAFIPCKGDEIRALRRLQREQEASPHVFASERGGPMSAKSFRTLFARLGERAGMAFPIFPHMLRHACGYALANAGHDSRVLQAWLSHKNIQHTLAPDRFKDFWR